jgi:hypothetical protein
MSSLSQKVFDLLNANPGGLSTPDIARILGCKRRTVTLIVGRSAAAGKVTCDRDPAWHGPGRRWLWRVAIPGEPAQRPADHPLFALIRQALPHVESADKTLASLIRVEMRAIELRGS